MHGGFGQSLAMHARWIAGLLACVLAACAHPHHQPPDTAVAAAGAPAAAVLRPGAPHAAAPTVVFQSGLGDGHAVWREVLAQLPPALPAIAADRPGYGERPAGAGPRDACHIAAEQRALLQRSGLRPPYVLVGHSLGGLYQYVYARLYPQEVAGLVLLDPTHPDLLATLQREQPAAASVLRLARQLAFTPAMRQEFDAQADCLQQLPGRAPLAVPTLLLASTRQPFYMTEELQSALDGLRADWLRRTGALLLPVQGSGHHLHRDAPHAVAQAVQALTARAAPLL